MLIRNVCVCVSMRLIVSAYKGYGRLNMNGYVPCIQLYVALKNSHMYTDISNLRCSLHPPILGPGLSKAAGSRVAAWSQRSCSKRAAVEGVGWVDGTGGPPLNIETGFFPKKP